MPQSGDSHITWTSWVRYPQSISPRRDMGIYKSSNIQTNSKRCHSFYGIDSQMHYTLLLAIVAAFKSCHSPPSLWVREATDTSKFKAPTEIWNTRHTFHDDDIYIPQSCKFKPKLTPPDSPYQASRKQLTPPFTCVEKALPGLGLWPREGNQSVLSTSRRPRSQSEIYKSQRTKTFQVCWVYNMTPCSVYIKSRCPLS